MKEFDYSQLNDSRFGIYSEFCKVNQIKPSSLESLNFFKERYVAGGGIWK